MIKCEDSVNSDDKAKAEEHTRKVFEEAGIVQDDMEMTKEKFQNFMRSLLNRPDSPDAKEPKKLDYVERIVQKISKNVPDKFSLEEMSKYVDERNMVRVIEEVQKEMSAGIKGDSQEKLEESNTEL